MTLMLLLMEMFFVCFQEFLELKNQLTQTEGKKAFNALAVNYWIKKIQQFITRQ